MKRMILGAVLGMAMLGGHVSAHEFTSGNMTVHHPAMNATPAQAQVAVGYMTLRNDGTEADRIVSISAPEIADKAEIHNMTLEDGVMKMRKIDGGLEIKPGETVTLAPDGAHVMFMGLKKQLVANEKYGATVHFEKAGDIAVTFNVEPIGSKPQAMGAMNHMDHHAH